VDDVIPHEHINEEGILNQPNSSNKLY